MKLKLTLLLLLLLIEKSATSQELNTKKLDELFYSLEKRDEAMGCITISKNGKIIYEKAFGYRYINKDSLLEADVNTNYRIWSITKMYSATMIFQLVEEKKLSLSTTLSNFYPEIPNAEIITIENMLEHKSGIPDFSQNLPDILSVTKGMTSEIMVENIARLKADFQPGTKFKYSNSNYLLLGYIIETLDNSIYETSLQNRISSRIGLTNTYFKNEGLNALENKAFTYQYRHQWSKIDEGMFSGPIPAGAGGILSTTKDMSRFIEALFHGKLISKNSLKLMMQGEDFYRLGMMQTHFESIEGFGHTGGYIASESSLFYYPEDSLTIAYCTNGIVIRKEEILNHVLKIYHNLPFAISINRKLQALIILFTGLIILGGMRLTSATFFKAEHLLALGFIIAFLFWTGILISGFLNGDYNHFQNSITELDAFYSNSGSFMSSIQFIIALLAIPFLYVLINVCLKKSLNITPLIPIALIPLAMAGTSLFPYPNKLNSIFINLIILAALSPLAALFFWRKKRLNSIQLLSVISLLPIIISLGLLISRPMIPVFVGNNMGFIQRLLYLGLTLWLASLSFSFNRISSKLPY